MKTAVALLILSWASLCEAQNAELGDYVVVRGTVIDCENWTSRPLDVVRVENEYPVKLLGQHPVRVLGLSVEEIRNSLVREIEALTGSAPESIRISILKSESEYRGIMYEYGKSMHHLSQGTCGDDSRRSGKDNYDWQSPPNLNEEMRRVYGLGLSRRIV